MIIFYGHPALLDVLSPRLVLSFNDINKVKSFILIDKVNAHKELLEKTNSLDPERSKTPL